MTDQTRLLAREIVARYPRPRSALLPLLHLVQSEHGYVSPEGVRFCAEELGLTKAEVGAVATFYTMYKRRPAGEYLVSVCTNTLCDVLGGEEIYRALSEHLGVGHDETTGDGRITLEHAECLAACDYAPVVTVNYEFFDQQSPESALDLVGELQAGRQPMPTRGAPLCTFKEISRQLAGFPDERPDAVHAGPAGEPTLVGNRLAVQRGETAPPYGEPAPLDGDRRDGDRRDGESAADATPPAAKAPAETPAGAPATDAATAGSAPAAGERSTDAAPGERTGGSAAPDTGAERSAADGTARYGGPPGEASSGGGEGDGLHTAASDPARSAPAAAHEPDSAKADATGSAGTGGDAGPGPATSPATADATGESPAAGSAPTDRPRPTNRGRRSTPRKEG